MTIKKKLVFSSIVQLILLLSIGMAVFLGYRYVSAQASMANEFDRQTMYLQMMLRGINEVIITEGTPQSVEIAEKGARGFEEIMTRLLSATEGSQIHNVLTEHVAPKWETIRENIKPFFEQHLDVEAEGLMIKYGKVITDTSALIKEISSYSDEVRAVVDSDSKKTTVVQYIMLIALISTVMAGGLISFNFYRSIMLPINELKLIAEGFGKGDLSNLMNESRRDEFGDLALFFNQATDRLGSFIRKMKENINTLVSNSQEFSSISSNIAINSKEQSGQTTQAATAIEELSSSFSAVAKNAVDAASSAREASELANNGGKVVTETIQSMDSISGSVSMSAGTIENLGKNSEQIGEIIKVINDIASQTNLLALNAAIEAARAGEQGRGFAVVADEVRKLAEKTTQATNEIGDMIKSIQDKTGNAVEAMQRGTKDVEFGVGLANQAGESLTQIVNAVQNVTDMIQQIATAAEEQSMTGTEIATNIESVADITTKTAGDAQNTSAHSSHLYEMASELQGLVSEFKLRQGNTHDERHQMEGSLSSARQDTPDSEKTV